MGEVIFLVRLHMAFHKAGKHESNLLSHLMGINWNQPAAKTAQPTSQNGGEDWLPLFVYQESDEIDIIVPATSRSFAQAAIHET